MAREKCPFCDEREMNERLILRGDNCVSIWDKHPINKGHALIIPNRHVSSPFDLTFDETRFLLELLGETRKLIEGKFQPNGYNIGINVGPVAGQRVMHVHIHIIPRYQGDLEFYPRNSGVKKMPVISYEGDRGRMEVEVEDCRWRA